MLTAFMYVLVPMPILFFGGGGGGSGLASGWRDAGQFLTGFAAIGAHALRALHAYNAHDCCWGAGVTARLCWGRVRMQRALLSRARCCPIHPCHLTNLRPRLPQALLPSRPSSIMLARSRQVRCGWRLWQRSSSLALQRHGPF